MDPNGQVYFAEPEYPLPPEDVERLRDAREMEKLRRIANLCLTGRQLLEDPDPAIDGLVYADLAAQYDVALGEASGSLTATDGEHSVHSIGRNPREARGAGTPSGDSRCTGDSADGHTSGE